MAEEMRKNLRHALRELRIEKREKQVNERRPDVPVQFYLTLREFSSLLTSIKSSKRDFQYWRDIKNALALGEDYIESFIRSDGAVDTLVSVLVGADTANQLEAAGCVVNLSSSAKAAPRICKAAAPYLVTFLNGHSSVLKESCALALGNLASNGSSDKLLAMGFLLSATRQLESQYPSVVESTVFALWCYTSNATMSSREIEEVHLVRKLVPHLTGAFLSDVSRILFNLYTRIDDLNVDEELSTSICETLMKSFLKLATMTLADVVEDSNAISVLTPVQRCLAAMAASSSRLAERVATECCAKDVLRACLNSPYPHIRKECLFLISNIAPWIKSVDEATATALVIALYTHCRDKDSSILQNVLFSRLQCSLLAPFAKPAKGDDEPGTSQQAETEDNATTSK